MRGALLSCLSNGSQEVSIVGSRSQFPFRVLFGRHATTATTQKPFHSKRIICVGAALSGWLPAIPENVLESFVVCMLQEKKGSRQYGAREETYNPNDWSTCRGPTAPGFGEDVTALLTELICLGAEPSLALLGVSAGVDRILSIVEYFQEYQLSDICIESVTAISGDFHPKLFKSTSLYLQARDVKVFVFHHEGDTLCVWPPVKKAWEDMKCSSTAAIFIRELCTLDPLLMDRNCHNISHFLLCQRAYWKLLVDIPRLTSEQFLKICDDDMLGLGYMCSSSDVVDASSCHYSYIKFAHLYSLAFCFNVAVANAIATHGFQYWLHCVMWSCRGCNTSFYRDARKTLLEVMSSNLHVGEMLARHIPIICFNALSSLKEPGSVLRSTPAEGRVSAIEVVNYVGPLTVVHVSFPEEFNHGKRYADVHWNSTMSIDDQSLPNKPSSVSSFRYNALHVSDPTIFHEKSAAQFKPVDVDDQQSGLQIADFLSCRFESMEDDRAPLSLQGVVIKVQQEPKHMERIRGFWMLVLTNGLPKDPTYVALKSQVRLRLHNEFRGILSWGVASDAHPDLFATLVGIAPPEQSKTQLQVLAGPPGTGKTTTATKILLTEKRKRIQVPANFYTLSCSWTNQATQQQFESFVRLARSDGFMNIEYDCVFIVASEDNSKGKSKGKGKGKDKSSHQCLTLSLNQKDCQSWTALVRDRKHLHVFCTIGKLSVPSRDIRGLPFDTPIDLFQRFFHEMHIDEFGTVLHMQHLLPLGRRNFKMHGSGDIRQLPAYAPGLWRLAPTMRYAIAAQRPRLLSMQYRLPAGLDEIVNQFFYEGQLKSATAEINTSLQYCVVALDLSDYNEDCRGSPTEAALANALWSKLGLQRDEDMILAFYGAQKRLLEKFNVDVSTVDAGQGKEKRKGIVSLGRRGPSLGFTKDRRRVNVSFSRWLNGLIILMHKAIGERASPDDDNIWYHIRAHARKLGVEIQLNAQELADVTSAADKIVSFINSKPSVDRVAVKAAMQDHRDFFDNYQLDLVGALDSALEIPPSDDEFTADEFTCGGRHPACNVEILTDACREKNEEGEHDEAANISEDDFSDWADIGLDGEVLEGDISLSNLKFTLPHTVRGHNLFTFVVIQHPHKLFHQHTFHWSPNYIQWGHTTLKRTLQLALCGFATLLHQSLAKWYGKSDSWTEAICTHLDETITYPAGVCITIRQLLSSPKECETFLWTLFGHKEHLRGSPLFYLQHDNPSTAPRLNLKNMQWQILLPFALVWPMLRTHSKAQQFPAKARSSQARSKQGDSQNEAVKFLLDLPVQTYSDDDTLSHSFLRDLVLDDKAWRATAISSCILLIYGSFSRAYNTSYIV